MKKLKIMLLSIALLAVVGGALAFKANLDRKFCVIDMVENGQGVLTCPVAQIGNFCHEIGNVKTTIQAEPLGITTCGTFKGALNCDAITTCTTFTKTLTD
jgi:hypothetical protein